MLVHRSWHRWCSLLRTSSHKRTACCASLRCSHAWHVHNQGQRQTNNSSCQTGLSANPMQGSSQLRCRQGQLVRLRLSAAAAAAPWLSDSQTAFFPPPPLPLMVAIQWMLPINCLRWSNSSGSSCYRWRLLLLLPGGTCNQNHIQSPKACGCGGARPRQHTPGGLYGSFTSESACWCALSPALRISSFS